MSEKNRYFCNVSQQVFSEVVLSRTVLQLTIAHASTILVLIELFPSNIIQNAETELCFLSWVRQCFPHVVFLVYYTTPHPVV